MSRLARFAVIAITLVSLGMQPSDLPAANQELSLSQYIAELRTASNVLDGRNAARMREFRASLPAEWVVLTSGQSLGVKTDWLASALSLEENASAASKDRVRQAQQHLAALREAAEALGSPEATFDLAQTRARADRILRDAEFQGSHEPSWLDNLKARVSGWISRQLNRIFGHMAISAGVGTGIAWALVTAVFLLLVFWAVRFLVGAASRSEMDLRGGAPAGQDWRYWAIEARSGAERGDYRLAIHAAYWAAVTRLEENQVLPVDRSRTPRESLREIDRVNAAYTPLSHLTRHFELTWYGYRAATPDDWHDAMLQLEMLGCLRSSIAATASS